MLPWSARLAPRLTLALLLVAGAARAQTYDVKRYGARGDGVTDDTVAIQAAVDAAAAAGGGEVVVPAGVYRILVHANNAHHGIALKSRTSLRLLPGAELAAIPTSSGNYSIVRIWEQEDVAVRGGTLTGERNQHLGTGGEWGFGVDIRGSKNVTIEGVTARELWGDGFYVDRTDRGPSRNVRIHGCRADRNRRQGLSIVGCVGATVTDSEFTNTQGVNPEGGIDLEPDPGVTHNIVEDVKISGCHFENNTVGVIFAGVSKNVVRGCTIRGSRLAAVHIVHGSHNVITANVIHDNARALLTNAATRNIFSDNVVTGSHGHALEVVNGSSQNLIADNTIDASGRSADANFSGIYIGYGSDKNVVRGNTLRSATSGARAAYGITIATWNSQANVLSGNDLDGAGAVAPIRNDGTGTVVTAP